MIIKLINKKDDCKSGRRSNEQANRRPEHTTDVPEPVQKGDARSAAQIPGKGIPAPGFRD